MRLQDQPLGQLARRIPGATGIFHDYDLDFCCGGKQTLRDAAVAKGLDAEAIETRLQTLQRDSEPVQTDWGSVPPASLIAHILTRFHERHREQLPELIRLARRVEHVHGDRPDCRSAWPTTWWRCAPNWKPICRRKSRSCSRCWRAGCRPPPRHRSR